MNISKSKFEFYDQTYAGPYSPKKQVYKKSDTGIYTEVGNWTSGFTANGYRMIRFADVLLLLAECQIETNDLEGALENINAVRSRAANTGVPLLGRKMLYSLFHNVR